ncbi:hypothetical protein HAX54_004329, partial [Datura stramonium]|nr:hypothetical protein [Datura stramonium]
MNRLGVLRGSLSHVAIRTYVRIVTVEVLSGSFVDLEFGCLVGNLGSFGEELGSLAEHFGNLVGHFGNLGVEL